MYSSSLYVHFCTRNGWALLYIINNHIRFLYIFYAIELLHIHPRSTFVSLYFRYCLPCQAGSKALIKDYECSGQQEILKLTSRKVCAGFDLTNFVSQSRLMNFMLAKEIGFQVLSSLTLYICIRSYNLISERLLDIKCLFVAISWSELHAHPKVLTSIKLNDQVLIPCNIQIRSYNFIV